MRFLPILATLFLAVPAASAKEFGPGEIFLCGATQCRVVKDTRTIRLFGTFLYGAGRVAAAPTPRVGSPVFQLRFRDGPAGVILSETSARVHGLNCSRFQRGRWYRLPPGLRNVTIGLNPKRLRGHVPPSC